MKGRKMAPWSLLRVNYIPMTLGIIFALGMVICFVTAVALGDVSPYIPFISETGGQYPEAGLFSIFLYLTSAIGFSTIFVRYLIVNELNRHIDRSIDVLNRLSIVIGFIALMGMVVVAAYPMTTIATAHAVGANVLFVGGVVYAILQTWQSYKMSPYYNGILICHIRLIITILSAISLIALLVMLPIAMSEWNSQKHEHWTGGKTPLDKLVIVLGGLANSEWYSTKHGHEPAKKTPNDQGFDLMLASSVSEWSMAFLFIGYYFTFIREFGKVRVHLSVQLLVQHFDEDPDENVKVATERTPIVM